MDLMHASMDLELVKNISSTVNWLSNKLLESRMHLSESYIIMIRVFLDAQKKNRGSDALCPQTLEMVLNLSWAC